MRREKLEEDKEHGQQFNYRLIFRTSEVSLFHTCEALSGACPRFELAPLLFTVAGILRNAFQRAVYEHRCAQFEQCSSFKGKPVLVLVITQLVLRLLSCLPISTVSEEAS